MCGFYGIVGNNKNSSKYLQEAKKLLLKRGEDGFGELNEESFSLLHARLNLNGEGDSGNQPIKIGNKIVLYNGEIYNKSELIKRFNFNKNSSDTQIICNLINEKSLFDVTNLINGMYSIAVLNLKSYTLELSVDSYGQKPLFYRISDTSVVFGSQAVAVKPINSNINKDQLIFYLNFGFVNPVSSFFKDVHRVQPGETITLDIKSLNKKISEFKEIKTREWNNGDLIRNYFDEYVDSPFPIGVTLSGGIDSSVIAHEYSNSYKGRKIAFTVQVGDKGFSEAPQAKEYAELLEIDHKIIDVPDEKVKYFWESGLSVLDEPNSDSSIITTAALMDEAKKHVKCLISGDGGDEIFGGYNRHKLGFLFSKFQNTAFLKKILNTASLYPSFLKKFVKLFFPTATGGEFDLRINSLTRALNSKDLWELYSSSLAIDDFFINKTKSLYFYNKNAFSKKDFSQLDMIDLDRYFYLIGNNLTRMDKISLGYGVECRSPLLDDRIKKAHIDEIRFESKPKLTKLHRHIYGNKKIVKKGFSYPIEDKLLGSDYEKYIKDAIDISNQILDENIELSILNSGNRRNFNLASLGLWCSKNL